MPIIPIICLIFAHIGLFCLFVCIICQPLGFPPNRFVKILQIITTIIIIIAIVLFIYIECTPLERLYI